jgi:tetratricopeptide (TPR) repeat protein
VIPRLNISAGEAFELIRPIVVVVSILLSACVLASARKRFSTFVACAWAVGTLLLPLVVLPLYLAVILIWQWPVRLRRWRWLLPLACATVLLAGFVMFTRHENATVDAHLARAAQAKLVEDHAAAISEYRTALTIENNAHTHKLLALELMQAGHLREAISEFRVAQQGGEPDDFIHYHLGLVFERLELKGEARTEFEKFLLSTTCTQEHRECEEAREGIRRLAR